MKRMATIPSLLASIPLAASVALAGPGGECGGKGGPWHHGKHGGHFERHLEELDLTAEQKEKVQAILDESKEKREGRHEKIREAYGELHELLEKESPDQAAIDAQIEKLGEMKTEAHKDMMRTLLSVRAELTPEQREKLKQMKRDR